MSLNVVTMTELEEAGLALGFLLEQIQRLFSRWLTCWFSLKKIQHLSYKLAGIPVVKDQIFDHRRHKHNLSFGHWCNSGAALRMV